MKCWVAIWINAHACGMLPGEHSTYEEAHAAGEAWRNDMIANDSNPKEAAQQYMFEVEQRDPELLAGCHPAPGVTWEP